MGEAINTINVYKGWQWRNVFIPIYASWSGRHDVGQGNVNILQHLQLDRQTGASNKCFFLNWPIQFYLNNVKNVNFTKYDIMPYNAEIISWPQTTVTSLHPIYTNIHAMQKKMSEITYSCLKMTSEDCWIKHY